MKPFIPINSVADAHRVLGLDSADHPLISVVNLEDLRLDASFSKHKYVFNLYHIALKVGKNASFGYGRNSYDFQDGTLVFIAPGQVISPEHEDKAISGWILLFHPDLLRGSELGNKINTLNYFAYSSNEALHVSKKEKTIISNLVHRIQEEYNQNIDNHSQNVIISIIDLLLNYCTRFYERQFNTRANNNKKYILQFEQLLREYFNSNKPLEMGLPTVKYCGEAMHMSPKYLSDLLRKETGRSTLEHIHQYIINKAKNELLGSNLSISEIAYSLGFEYPQYFSNLFKKETKLSPRQYRNIN
ncbi:MAG: helix-turn-helix domain-containing protein [Flavobacteriaceae bacterium]|nr:helix-turn-helix domain-containing protein [Flavobacteriaceae bacterium]